MTLPKHGYITAHERIRGTRGKAVGYACSSCSSRADEWAYNHDSPDPNAVADGIGRVYSNDPSFYKPMCRPCHRLYDVMHAKPDCPRGHAYAGDNLVFTKLGHRLCRECRNEYQRNLRKTPEYQAKERARAERRKADYVPKRRPDVTHCPQGHAYEGDNLILDSGKKKCRECGKARSRRYYHEHKESK